VAKPVVDLQSASASTASHPDVELGSPLGANPPAVTYSVGASYSGFAPGKWESRSEDSDRSDNKGRRDHFDSFMANSLMSQRNSVFNSRGYRGAGNVPSFGAGRDAAKGSGGRRDDSARGSSGNAANPGRGNGGGNGQPKGDPGASGGLFNEHTSGLPNLNGSVTIGNGPVAAALGPKVAVNPEPSAIFLFGTGLAAVARLLRRRLS